MWKVHEISHLLQPKMLCDWLCRNFPSIYNPKCSGGRKNPGQFDSDKKNVLLQFAKWVTLKRNSKRNPADLIKALKCLEVEIVAPYAHVSTSESRALRVPGQVFVVHAQRYSKCLEGCQN